MSISKHSLGKRIGKIAAGLLILSGVGLIVYMRLDSHVEAEVRSGKLGYTTQASWINWGHARIEGTALFLGDLRQRWQASGGRAFRVTFVLRMSGVYLKILVTSTVEREYQIESCPDQAALERIALGIYRETHEDFESMQGDFPNGIDAASQESSFRDGDLRADLIAFYRALRGYPEEDVRSWLGAVSTKKSLALLETHPIGKSRSWEWPPTLAGGRLDEIRHDPAWFVRHATLIHEQRKNFRLGLP